MFRFLAATLFLVLVVAAVAPVGAQNADETLDQEQGNDAGQDVFSIPASETNLWTQKCLKNQISEQQICEILADIYTGRGVAVLLVAFGKTDGGKQTVMRLQTPLGTLLPSGITLQVDNTPALVFQYLLCAPDGCQVQAFIPDELLAVLQEGQELTFRFFDRTNSPIVVSLPLEKFGIAFEALPAS